MSKKENKIKGNFGEDLACNFLEKSGYQIILRNFKCIYGEIDIIAADNKDIIFVEVKTKYQNNFGNPIDAINFVKEKHIYNVAKYYLYITNSFNLSIRFDAIEIFISNKEKYSISHIKNIILDEPPKNLRRKFK